MSTSLRPKIRFALLICFIIFLSPVLLLIQLGYLLRLDFSSAWCQIFSLVPGIFGLWLRRAYYYTLLNECSGDVSVGFGTLFTKKNIRIAPGVSIGGYCMIGMCEIGENTLLGSNIDILSGRHQHGKGTGTSLEQRKSDTNIFTTVKIGKNCWIGNGAIIMNDIGDNCIIGAGSVVVNPIPSNTVAVGNPAKVVRDTTVS